jgi:hypothetical protein
MVSGRVWWRRSLKEETGSRRDPERESVSAGLRHLTLRVMAGVRWIERESILAWIRTREGALRASERGYVLDEEEAEAWGPEDEASTLGGSATSIWAGRRGTASGQRRSFSVI